MSTSNGKAGAITAGLIFFLTMTAHAIVVTPNDPTWWFLQETPNGSGTFASGPSTPPLGSGSVQLTVDDTGGEDVGTLLYAGTMLDTITSLSYSTYRVSGSSDLAPALDLDVDTVSSTTAWEGRLVYEPYYTHAVPTGAWVTWNPLDNASSSGIGNWWFTGAPGNTVCPISAPCTWAEILADFPNADVRPPAEMGELLFKAGGGWTGGFVGNVDAFSIGVNGVTTTYDFELSSPVPTTTQALPSAVQQVGGISPFANVYFYGQAYPGSVINVFQKSAATGPYAGTPLTSASVGSDGIFQVAIKNFLQGNYFFAIQAIDKDGQESQLLPIVSGPIASGDNLTFHNILVPPTIDVAPAVVPLDQSVVISGYAAPSSSVEIWIDDALLGETTSDASGAYAFTAGSAQLSAADHTAKTRFILPSGAESDFSLETQFRVSPLALPTLDLSGDGVINAADLSIFLSLWNSTDTASQSRIEFDGASAVDISDLSILLNAIRLQ